MYRLAAWNSLYYTVYTHFFDRFNKLSLPRFFVSFSLASLKRTLPNIRYILTVKHFENPHPNVLLVFKPKFFNHFLSFYTVSPPLDLLHLLLYLLHFSLYPIFLPLLLLARPEVNHLRKSKSNHGHITRTHNVFFSVCTLSKLVQMRERERELL
jgi:hypothetical protein